MGTQLELPLGGKKKGADLDVDVAAWVLDLMMESTQWSQETALTIATNLASKVESRKATAFDKARMMVALDRHATVCGTVGGLKDSFPELDYVKNLIRFRHVTALSRSSRR